MANHPWTIAPCGGIRLDSDSFEIRYENDDERKPYISCIGGGGGEPAKYLKEAELLADGGLKITKKDGTALVFADGGYVKDVTATADKIKVTKWDGTVVEIDKTPAKFVKDVVKTDEKITFTKKDDTTVVVEFTNATELEDYLDTRN